MAEYSDTTTGVVGTNGYPTAPTLAYVQPPILSYAFGYSRLELLTGTRIGTLLRFWDGFTGQGGGVQNPPANQWIYDFFDGDEWPTAFRSCPVGVVTTLGDCAPPGRAVVRFAFPDAHHCTSPVVLPTNPFRAYRITMSGPPPALPSPPANPPEVGWLFVHDQAGAHITIAVDPAFIDAGSSPPHRPHCDHAEQVVCNYLHTGALPPNLNGLMGQTL